MSEKGKQIVYARFPDTGLGNKLLIWAKAFAFAKKHGLAFFCSSWWGIHLGSWLRNEKQKRLYWNYFKEDGWLKRLRLYFFSMRALSVNEPESVIEAGSRVMYTFHEVVTSKDYFRDIKPFRNEVKAALYDLLQPSLRVELDTYDAPVIGVHIRRGDFKLGSTLTPESYFIDCIKAIRTITEQNLPVEIFTDAYPGEIADLLALPNVSVTKPKADILDILQLSRSRICILSISSTFSFWAGFLSDGIVLLHPGEWHPALRPEEVNIRVFEGKFDPLTAPDEQLITQLKQIRFEEKN